MLLANRVLDSDEAVRFGLVSRLTPFADLIAETAKVAAQLANAAPNAILKSKSLIRQGREQVAAQMEKESILFAEQLDSPEFAEVIAAKTQKRMPNFT